MKILFLSTSSADNPSPRGRWLPIARELVALGHSVELALLHPAFDRLAPERKRFEADGVTISHVAQMHVYEHDGQQHYFSAPKLAQVSAHAARMLLRAAIASAADAIHICKPQPMNALAGILAARRLNVPLYLDCDDYEAAANRFSSAWQRALVRYWEDRTPRYARGITANTRFLLDRNRALVKHNDRMRLVPNGIDAAQCVPPDPKRVALLRAAHNLPEHTVAYLGAMSTVAHGVGLLIDAFARVRAEVPDARLLMIGEGADRAALAAQAEKLGLADSVLWLGRVPREQTAEYLATAACSVDPVFDQPAMRGRSPLKIIESMAAGVPVVTGDVGDRRETLQDGAAGVIVEPGQAAALANGIVSLLRFRAHRERLGHNGQTRARDYDWRALAAHWATVYS